MSDFQIVIVSNWEKTAAPAFAAALKRYLSNFQGDKGAVAGCRLIACDRSDSSFCGEEVDLAVTLWLFKDGYRDRRVELLLCYAGDGSFTLPQALPQNLSDLIKRERKEADGRALERAYWQSVAEFKRIICGFGT